MHLIGSRRPADDAAPLDTRCRFSFVELRFSEAVTVLEDDRHKLVYEGIIFDATSQELLDNPALLDRAFGYYTYVLFHKGSGAVFFGTDRLGYSPFYYAWEKGTLSLYDNVAEIAKKEGELGFHSSFYYMSAEYPLANAKPTAQKIHGEGWEVGLHGDFGTHDSAGAMRAAVDRLMEGVGIRPLGVREHYLKFDYAKTWPLLEDSGFDYDSTPGNTDALGFKLGLATPFHPPDSRWKAMRLLELPLSLMDTTLWGYLKKGEEEGLADVARFMDMVEELGGLFTLLWHQEAVRMKGGRIYWKVLKKVERSGAFVGSGAEIANWWRAREVPLEVGKDGKLITLGGAAPKGLVIQLKTEERAKVISSSARRKERIRDGYREHEFRQLGSAFKLELRG